MQIAIGIVLIIAAVFLIIAVLLQHGKNHNLSGAIAGGAETFFGKEKGSTIDKKLSKLTTIVAIIFALLVLVSYFIQDTPSVTGNAGTTAPAAETEAAETEAAGDTVENGASGEDAAGDVTEP